MWAGVFLILKLNFPCCIVQFSKAKFFDIDLSTWNISQVANMTRMFYGAISFNQSLCSWQDFIDTDVSTTDLFESTACIHTNDPISIPTSLASFCTACQG
jgi:Mycoplasma protein of unknown function, DUF285